MISSRSLTLADVALARLQDSVWKDALLILAGSLLTALAAQVAIPLPFTPVPLTGQTFAVMLCGAAMGWRRGAAAQVMYLLEGCCGLPVFAHGGAGFAPLLGPTGGYLLGFPLAAALTGWLAQRGWDRTFWRMFLCMLLGSTIIFACGMLGLSRFVPPRSLLGSGVLPFIPGDLIKAALAAAAFPTAWRLIGRGPRMYRKS